MKLFTAKEIDVVAKEKTSKRISEGVKLSKAVERERTKLIELTDERKRLENTQRDEIIKLQSTHEQRKSALLNEITSLEQRRADLLKPVDEIIERAKKREAEAVEAQLVLDNKIAVSTKFLTKTSKEERKATELKQKAGILLAEADRMMKNARNEAQVLKQDKDMFALAVKDSEDLIKEKMALVKRLEDKSIVKAAQLEEKEKFLTDKEALLNQQSLRIKSDRLALEAAQKEIYGR